jgi:hypothetical protein
MSRLHNSLGPCKSRADNPEGRFVVLHAAGGGTLDRNPTHAPPQRPHEASPYCKKSNKDIVISLPATDNDI